MTNHLVYLGISQTLYHAVIGDSLVAAHWRRTLVSKKLKGNEALPKSVQRMMKV